MPRFNGEPVAGPRFGGEPVDDYQPPAWLSQMTEEESAPITDNMSTMEKFAAGYGAAVPNMWAGIKQRMGLVDQEEIDERKRMQAPLMDTGAGIAGSIAGNVVALIPTAGIPGANTIAGAGAIGAASGLIQPTATGESVAKNTALGGLGGAAGQKAAQLITGGLAKAASRKAASAAENATREATLSAGKQAGYVVAPSNANPNAWNRLLQGLAGKTATGQRAAMLNQKTTNKLAREALGLSPDAELSPEVLAGVRKQAGQAYESLRQFDEIALDEQYMDDVLEAVKPYMDTVKEFPDLANKEIGDVVQMVNRDKVSGNGLIAVTKRLREKADAAYRAGEKDTGKFFKGVSDAMEGAAERHLAASGDEAATEGFRNARQLIAKTYSVENSLNPSTGNIVASKLAAQFKKGKPLSGELKEIGKFSGAFPRETQEVANSSWLQMPGPSPLDYIAGLASLVGSGGNPLAASTVVARPMAQALLTSKPYQAAMTTPSHAPGAVAKALRAATGSRGGQHVAGLLGAQAGLNAP